MLMIEANGARIPAIGLGTLTLKDAACAEAVKTALRLGYRHIDTAERYGNEAAVGEGLYQGLQAAGLRREDVFVTTKVYHDKLAAAFSERSLKPAKRLRGPTSCSSIGRTKCRSRGPSARSWRSAPAARAIRGRQPRNP
jgi:diketogulonate reductase-like aldo/keto reductase